MVETHGARRDPKFRWTNLSVQRWVLPSHKKSSKFHWQVAKWGYVLRSRLLRRSVFCWWVRWHKLQKRPSWTSKRYTCRHVLELAVAMLLSINWSVPIWSTLGPYPASFELTGASCWQLQSQTSPYIHFNLKAPRPGPAYQALSAEVPSASIRINHDQAKWNGLKWANRSAVRRGISTCVGMLESNHLRVNLKHHVYKKW